MNKKISQGAFVAILFSLQACMTPSIVATQSIQLGNQANNQHRYEDAITHYENYITVSPQLGLYRDYSKEAEVYRKLAYVYSTQGKFGQAEQCLSKATKTDSLYSPNKLTLIEDYRQLGTTYAYKGDYPRALEFLNKALQLNSGMDRSVKNVRRNSLAETNLSLAQVHVTLGNYREAELHAWRALAIFDELPDGREGEVESNLILGIILREKSELDRAEKALMQSMEMAARHNLNTSRQNQAISEVHMLRGQIEDAVRYKLLALEQAEKTNIKPQIIIATMRLGDVYQQLGDEEKANSYYQKAMSLQSATGGDTSALAPSLQMRMGDSRSALGYYMNAGSSLGAAMVSLRLGEMKFAGNEPDSARYFFSQARTYFETVGSKEGVANASIQLAKIQYAKGDYERSRSLLQEAKANSIQPDIQWQVCYRTGLIDRKTGKPDSARANFQRAIRIIDELRGNLTVEEFKTLFANTKVEVYDQMIQLLLTNRDRWKRDPRSVEETSLYYSEQSRSRAFLDMIGNKKIGSKKSADSTMLEEEQALRLKVQQLARELTATEEYAIQRNLREELHTAQEAHQRIVERIKLHDPAYATMVPVEPVQVQAIQQILKPGTAVLEYWLGEESLVTWVITKQKVTVSKTEISRKDVLREVQGCRNAIALQMTEVFEKGSKKLYDILFNPVQPHLQGIQHLVIVPHSSLHFLPFQALQSARGKFLVEDYVISYAPSLSIFYYCMQKKPAKRDEVLALALGSEPVGGYEALPGTAIEIDQLGRLYNEDKFVNQSGTSFTETFFKKQAPDYGYVHLATHGVLNSYQPLYSHIVMHGTPEDDGRLTVDEIFNMHINGRLVALSACETALGDLGHSDELVGLSRAFIYAGAPAVVVSLWKVEDATTAWLMTRFHQYLIAGSDMAEALTAAQRDLITRQFDATKVKVRGLKDVVMDESIMKTLQGQQARSLRNPFYWAPFILIGAYN